MNLERLSIGLRIWRLETGFAVMHRGGNDHLEMPSVNRAQFCVGYYTLQRSGKGRSGSKASNDCFEALTMTVFAT